MPEFTFQRTGQAALSCEGEIIAQATSRTEKFELSSRWHELTLVRAASGRYVLAVSFDSTYKHEVATHDAWVLDRLEDVPPALEEYDPIAGVAGYPEGEQFETRQRKLLGLLETGFYAAVGRLLAQAGIVERV